MIVQEPISMCIGHELLHGIQNLKYPKPISSNILQELITRLPPQNAETHNWCAHFFAGSDGSTWPYELQAMVLGIEVDGQRLSEANLMRELLSGQYHGYVPELAQYTAHILVPFGHLGPGSDPKIEDMQNFCALLRQSGFSEVHDPVPPRRCEVA
ncbi:MAG: hypothetical protein LBH52_04295 [Puniceicoccales bacterium]|nr:hypothetical protein [Puniceicoccales bacterium]